jgi:hypothetical protein
MSFEIGDDVIDSRDIIERINELENERESLLYQNGGGMTQYEWDKTEEGTEYIMLSELAKECACLVTDWAYGETLIHWDYFKSYMDQMVEDCYELPKDLPYWMSIKLDYVALKQDYTSVYIDGHEYLIRSI